MDFSLIRESFLFLFFMVGEGFCFGDCSSFFHVPPSQNVLLFSPRLTIKLQEEIELKGTNIC